MLNRLPLVRFLSSLFLERTLYANFSLSSTTNCCYREHTQVSPLGRNWKRDGEDHLQRYLTSHQPSPPLPYKWNRWQTRGTRLAIVTLTFPVPFVALSRRDDSLQTTCQGQNSHLPETFQHRLRRTLVSIPCRCESSPLNAIIACYKTSSRILLHMAVYVWYRNYVCERPRVP